MVHFSMHPHPSLTVLLKVFSVVYLGHYFSGHPSPSYFLFCRVRSAGWTLHGQEGGKVKRRREKKSGHHVVGQ